MDSSPLALGFLGLGRMGLPMARRLLAAGHRVHAWDRDPERLSLALAEGAIACHSPAAVARAAEVVLSCLADAAAIEAVVFGPDGVATEPGVGRLFVDHASIAPDATQAFAERLRQASGRGWVDAPVSGSVVGAERGSLAILCGGDEAAFLQVRPILAAYGGSITHLGPTGTGQTAKLCNQIIVSSAMCAIAEAVHLAERAGLDAGLLPRALAGGAADSGLLQLLVPRMLTPPADSLGASHAMLKDLGAVLAFARTLGAPLPVTVATAQIFQQMIDAGQGGEEPPRLLDLYRNTEMRRDAR